MSTMNTSHWLLLALLVAANPLLAQALGEQKAAEPIRVLLAPARETTLASQIAGRLTEVNASLGSTFRKGDPLVRFDCSEQQARLKMSNADLASANETHQAKRRLQDLQQAGEVEVALAAIEADKARAQIALYRAQVEQCLVPAPFNGRVAKVAVKAFQSVSVGQPLLEIVSNETPKVRLNAPASWSAWLKPGTPLTVHIDETGQQYPATVSSINARIDAVSQTLELEATFTNDTTGLLPGMSGTARFDQEHPAP
ncbi:efflux RND transporter periplasmic adaptor subunit [Azotobacter beijerinckii]|uniref:efflux RND transporter periplasmic adaptor subunit n=1 Tax=Azotobacter beijerinckii TaxID=170623 RepID=UPI002954F8F1|nr:efflux RND transporter periplasmic adaptor subunit [Azotobacter beijerinckii]MDV7212110.1 efflux RND transporter periplasmic adaptor subunit [Azotobacter beijerinckii]